MQQTDTYNDAALIERAIARTQDIYAGFPMPVEPGWSKGEPQLGQIRYQEMRRAIQMIEGVNPAVAAWPTRSYERERAVWLKNNFSGPAIWREKTLIDTKGSRVKGILGKWYLRNSGMGGLLDPPGRATHFWSIEYRGKFIGHGCCALEGMLKQEDRNWVPMEVRLMCKDLLRRFPGDAQDESWIRECYNYFRGCYSPDGENRNVSDCVIPKTPIEQITARSDWGHRHLAYLHIRQYDPTHQLREDLI